MFSREIAFFRVDVVSICTSVRRFPSLDEREKGDREDTKKASRKIEPIEVDEKAASCQNQEAPNIRVATDVNNDALREHLMATWLG